MAFDSGSGSNCNCQWQGGGEAAVTKMAFNSSGSSRGRRQWMSARWRQGDASKDALDSGSGAMAGGDNGHRVIDGAPTGLCMAEL
jgi:hypothetical protein